MSDRLQVAAVEDMTDEIFLKHWRARHSNESTICHDEDVDWTSGDIASARRYHERLHDHRSWGKRLGTIDPEHDHV